MVTHKTFTFYIIAQVTENIRYLAASQNNLHVLANYVLIFGSKITFVPFNESAEDNYNHQQKFLYCETEDFCG